MKNDTNPIAKIKNKLLVYDVMTKSLLSLDETDTVFYAVYTMGKESISSIVIKKEDKLTGIFTERDVINRIVLPNKDPKKTKLVEVMTKSPRTINMNEPIVKASNIMRNEKVRKLIVVDDNNSPVGIISQTDIVNSLHEIDENYRSLLWNPKLIIAVLIVIIILFIINYFLFGR